jgi:histone deacetylase 11
MKIIYSPAADLGWRAIRRLHPFDGHKYSRAWKLLEQRFGTPLRNHTVDPQQWVKETRALLPEVHTADYMASLKRSATIASILEIPVLKQVPNWLLRVGLIDPMIMATAGCCAASEIALKEGFAFNFGGGFHHAYADHGEGFCVFNDVAIARQHLINIGMLAPDDPVWIIDLDAHRGNGNEDIFFDTPNIHFLDLYNGEAYPGALRDDDRFPHLHSLPEHMGVAPAHRPERSTDLYLNTLKETLSEFVAESPRPSIVYYNAGTDIVMGDALGRLGISDDGVAERDRHVIQTLRDLRLPTVMLTSGGYTDRSHQLIARTAAWALECFGMTQNGASGA